MLTLLQAAQRLLPLVNDSELKDFIFSDLDLIEDDQGDPNNINKEKQQQQQVLVDRLKKHIYKRGVHFGTWLRSIDSSTGWSDSKCGVCVREREKEE